MRRPRVKVEGEGFYHVVSRCVERAFKFDCADKAMIEGVMRRLARFCGVEVCTYALLDNHIHLLLRIPPRGELDDAELVGRIAALYGDEKAEETRTRWRAMRASGIEANLALLQAERAALMRRMGDLSMFMKELKQTISKHYNKSHSRKGTLWETRFFSVLLEDSAATLTRVATYIDLNAVRAGIVKNPADYAWGGFGRAMHGNPSARAGLMTIYRRSDIAGQFEAIAKRHEKTMMALIELGRARERCAKCQDEGNVEMAAGANARNDYFTRPVAIGGLSFVARIHAQFARCFGKARKPEPRDTGISFLGMNLYATNRVNTSAA